MDGKAFFQRCCQKEGLECTELFILGKTKKTQNKRYSHTFDHHQRKPSHKYVVLYVEDGDFYIGWSLNTPKAQSKDVFSVLAANLQGIKASEMRYVLKNIEYSGWNDETVLAFGREKVSDFLKQLNI